MTKPFSAQIRYFNKHVKYKYLTKLKNLRFKRWYKDKFTPRSPHDAYRGKIYSNKTSVY